MGFMVLEEYDMFRDNIFGDEDGTRILSTFKELLFRSIGFYICKNYGRFNSSDFLDEKNMWIPFEDDNEKLLKIIFQTVGTYYLKNLDFSHVYCHYPMEFVVDHINLIMVAIVSREIPCCRLFMDTDKMLEKLWEEYKNGQQNRKEN